MAKHKYLDLNLGIVKENFVVVNRKDIKLWKNRGFERIKRYPIFLYRPKLSEVVMLSKPLNINQFGIDSLKNSKIVDICTYLGTYGMGGPGFVGFKLQGYFGIRWLVYCIWSAGESILVDNRIMQCHPKYNEKYHPYIDIQKGESSLKDFKELINGWQIKDLILDDTNITITLLDNLKHEHTIFTAQFCNKFPEQGGTGKKRKSFENGKMSDYWLVIYDGSHLSV